MCVYHLQNIFIRMSTKFSNILCGSVNRMHIFVRVFASQLVSFVSSNADHIFCAESFVNCQKRNCVTKYLYFLYDLRIVLWCLWLFSLLDFSVRRHIAGGGGGLQKNGFCVVREESDECVLWIKRLFCFLEKSRKQQTNHRTWAIILSWFILVMLLNQHILPSIRSYTTLQYRFFKRLVTS
jgi:hypothetical protein